MADLRVGILGAGFMGKTHARHLSKSKGVVVDSICSQPLETAADLSNSATAGQAAIFEDFDEMLAERKLDAVYVCLPPFAHDGQIEAAARKGIHVFVEKPLGLTVESATARAKAIRKAGVVSQIGYHMRFTRPVQELLKRIQQGKAGRPTLFQATYFCNALHTAWWRDVRKSGGQVVEQAIHLYDLAMTLMGSPKTVVALADNLVHKGVPGYTVEDTSASVARLSSGALATIAASNCAVPTQWNGYWRAIFENLTAELTPAGAVFYEHGGKGSEYFFSKGKQVKQTMVETGEDPYWLETQAFLAAVRGKADPVATADDGLMGVKYVLAAMESAKAKGKVVTVR